MGVTYMSVGAPHVNESPAGPWAGFAAGRALHGVAVLPNIPLLTVALVASGFILYLINLGGLVYAINTKLRTARKQALEQQEELMLTNRLVATVNGSLDMDLILQTIMEGCSATTPLKRSICCPTAKIKPLLKLPASMAIQ